MKEYKEVLKDLDTALEKLESVNQDILKKAELGIDITKQILKKTKKLTIENGFKNKKDEMFFFKEIKPKIYSKLIYFVKLYNIESKRPRSSNKSKEKYLNNHIDRLQDYFNDNLEFYHYYRRDATSLDEHYFLLGKTDIRLFPDNFHCFTDEEFSTSHDNTVATILAYDMLIAYLKTEIDNLNNTVEHSIVNKSYKLQSKLFWTAHKTDLIELIYALHSYGVINSGTADIKEMAEACETIFNVDLGDFYRTFLEIRSRKINQTKFLDKLKESLLQKMRDSDE
ncbi:RteC domain-containing protein [Aquimarina addita]|uniref:RteC domain-containing protein n=1 Tax=Aquimarina addita TaxID=870485 RepID=A0ABP6UJ94_9FLAO